MFVFLLSTIPSGKCDLKSGFTEQIQKRAARTKTYSGNEYECAFSLILGDLRMLLKLNGKSFEKESNHRIGICELSIIIRLGVVDEVVDLKLEN